MAPNKEIKDGEILSGKRDYSTKLIILGYLYNNQANMQGMKFRDILGHINMIKKAKSVLPEDKPTIVKGTLSTHLKELRDSDAIDKISRGFYRITPKGKNYYEQLVKQWEKREDKMKRRASVEELVSTLVTSCNFSGRIDAKKLFDDVEWSKLEKVEKDEIITKTLGGEGVWCEDEESYSLHLLNPPGVNTIVTIFKNGEMVEIFTGLVGSGLLGLGLVDEIKKLGSKPQLQYLLSHQILFLLIIDSYARKVGEQLVMNEVVFTDLVSGNVYFSQEKKPWIDFLEGITSMDIFTRSIIPTDFVNPVKKLEKLLHKSVKAVNDAYPEYRDLEMDYVFWDEGETSDFFKLMKPSEEFKKRFCWVYTSKEKERRSIMVFRWEKLIRLDESLIIYDFVNMLLHEIFSDENEIHEKTLQILEKYFDVDPTLFMDKHKDFFWGGGFYEEKE
jgi:hypothetical protein